MKKDVWIMRREEMLEMIQDTADQIENLDPMPSEEYVSGLKAGLEISRKIAKRISYEAYEFDLHEKKDTPEA